MEKKDMYTLKELYGELSIPLAELGRRSGISEVTVAKIRDGASARRSTINSLLETFAEIYDIKLSINNVSDVIVNDKLARQEQRAAQSQSSVAEKAIESPVLPLPSDNTPAIPSPQKRATMANKGKDSETLPKKRQYKQREAALPDGCLSATNFARNHDVKRETFRDHMLNGLGPGLIGYATDTIPQRDHVEHETRTKPGRDHETERYLTPGQQYAALLFWQKHKVSFSECDQPECRCHDMQS